MQEYPLLFLIWLLPLFGAVLVWAFGPQLKTWAGPICSALVGVPFIAAVTMWGAATTGDGAHQTLFAWLPQFVFGLQLDRISLVWTMIITGVGFLIHVYSIGYMAGDKAFARFFAYLNFFIFAMLTLVLSDNFVGLLVGPRGSPDLHHREHHRHVRGGPEFQLPEGDEPVEHAHAGRERAGRVGPVIAGHRRRVDATELRQRSEEEVG